MGQRIIDRRHWEFTRSSIRWRWLIDSLEGGAIYRDATYGTTTGPNNRRVPVRNLVQHKREYPDDLDRMSSDPLAMQAGSDFAVRLSRTPTPTKVREAVGKHLAHIFSRGIKREGPPAVQAFWENTNGKGSTIDRWMHDEVAPSYLVLGQIDFLVDRPFASANPRTKAEEKRLGLDRVIGKTILPTNIPWWYAPGPEWSEALISEWFTTRNGSRAQGFRHWTTTGWTLYDPKGKVIGEGKHNNGRLPIIRVIDRLAIGSEWTGFSRYESLAELQREAYNADSELILSNTAHSHPILQGPSQYVEGEDGIPVGPGYTFPIAINPQTGDQCDWSIIEFPKGANESIREDIDRWMNDADRLAGLSKPAGSRAAGGAGAGVVAQSGRSKEVDREDLVAILKDISDSLTRAELELAKLALWVASDGQPDQSDLDAIKIVYPSDFRIESSDDLITAMRAITDVAPRMGNLPETEFELMTRYLRKTLPGLGEERYRQLDQEIQALLSDQHARLAAAAESLTSGGMNAIPFTP